MSNQNLESAVFTISNVFGVACGNILILQLENALQRKRDTQIYRKHVYFF